MENTRLSSGHFFLFFCALIFFSLNVVCSHVVILDSRVSKPGSVLFQAEIGRSVGQLVKWVYHLDMERSPAASRHFLFLNSHNGILYLRRSLPCLILPLYIEAWNPHLGTHEPKYVSIPLVLVSTGPKCPSLSGIISKISHRPFEVVATISQNSTDQTDICFFPSQLVISDIARFLPKDIRMHCEVSKWKSDDLKIETSTRDLVSPTNLCFQGPQLQTRVHYRLNCTNERYKNIANQFLLNKQYISITLKRQYHATVSNNRVRRAFFPTAPFYFDKQIYTVSIPEEREKDLPVITLTVRDSNTSIPVLYSLVAILDARSQKLFQIDPHSGVVTTSARLDREAMEIHYLRITAEDSSHPPFSATTTVQINVEDLNDFPPTFEQNVYETTIKESASIGSAVLTVRATDQDSGTNAEIHYSVVNPFGANEAFRIDPKSGIITSRLALDRETVESYNLTIQAVDQGMVTDRKSSTAIVLIRVMDENDNYPQFSEKTYTVEVPENISWTENPSIAGIRAVDADSGPNAVLRYSLIGGNNQGHFAIDSLTGDVTVVQPLDYEIVRNYRLVVRAQDGGNPTRSNTTQLLINVKDVNDNAPRFYTSLFQESVMENVAIGHSIVRVQAYDADDGPNAAITYKISLEAETLPFGVDPDTGWIITVRDLDREENHHYEFEVSAVDGGEQSKSATTKVILQIQDQNDNDPVFEPKIYESVISEDALPGTPVLTVTASDRDENPRLQYQIINGNVRGRFSITSQNGQGLLSVAQPLDYKQEKRFVLTISAADHGGRSDTATLYINVSDANTFSPVFETTPYSASVFEDAPIGTTVLIVSASDGDVGENARIIYSVSGEVVPEFSIMTNTGAIVTTKPLDREKISGYLLTITAKDNGNPPLSDTTDVEITVADVNDNAPVFNQPSYQANIVEEALIGTSILQVLAVDADQGLNSRVRYLLHEQSTADHFLLDATSGILRTNKALDREHIAKYDLVIYAVDRGSPELSTSVSVLIIVEDINDSPPKFESDRIHLVIAENSPIGSRVGEVRAHDPDEGPNAIIHYSIIGGNDADSFTLISRPELGAAELLTRIDLDYESPRKHYELVIRAASPPLRTDIIVQVDVLDVNDNVPVLKDFKIVFNNYKNYFPTGPITRVPVFDADVTDQLQYRVLTGNNANLVQINESTGEILLSPNLNTNVPISANMEVAVSDGINEVKSELQLSVLLVTEAMLFNSVTVRLNNMDQESFLSPLYNYFIDGLATVLNCPKENIYIFNIQDDHEATGRVLNVSFSAKRPDLPVEVFYTQQFLQERVYLQRNLLTKLTTLQVLPFDDTLCVREPCLNFEECLSVLKFGNASAFINSETILFRPIYPVSTFACRCPTGFTGMREHYVCDTEVNLCHSNPCGHGGKCIRKEGGYTCVCKPGFAGTNCQFDMNLENCKDAQNGNVLCHSSSQCVNKLPGIFCANCTGNSNFYTPLCQLRSRSFYRGSFLTFPALRQRYRLHLKLSFATRESNGLLLYNGRYNERNDFLAIEIIDGHIQFSYSLGANISRISLSHTPSVSDGQWHTVTVNYVNRTVILSLDDCDTALSIKFGHVLTGSWRCATQVTHHLDTRCAQYTETCHRFLDLTAPLQLGGLPSISSDFQVRNRNYSGCIRDLYIDNKLVDLNGYVADNGTVPGCQEKREFCNSAPCRNGGKCIEAYSSFFCDCPEAFSGKDCSESVEPAKQFKGDGYLIFAPNIRPIVLPWVTSFHFRTRKPNNFLLKMEIGTDQSFEIEMFNGKIQLDLLSAIHILESEQLNNGKWHFLEIKWMQGEVWISVDYGYYEKTVAVDSSFQGLSVIKVSLGGLEDTRTTDSLVGCIKDLRLGNQRNTWQPSALENRVAEGCNAADTCYKNDICPVHGACTDTWNDHTCTCEPGFAGFECVDICEYNPCENNSTCLLDKSDAKGYRCVCNSNYSGNYCEFSYDQPCPATWWGNPVCGPCECDTHKGYDPNCNKTTGECVCRENSYQPLSVEECLECNCYLTGSFGPKCDAFTGQCKCRSGVIGRRCDSCSNRFAEVTLNGCEVIYDACPRNFEGGVWFDRTLYGSVAVQNCPSGSFGKAYKTCDKDTGWTPADFFNCTSSTFIEIKDVVDQLDRKEIDMNPFLSVRLAQQLSRATNQSSKLYGSDIYISLQALLKILEYDTTREGFNMTHRQDKDFIRNIVSATSYLFQTQYIDHWRKIEEIRGYGAEEVLTSFLKYAANLAKQEKDTYTMPFEVVTPNMALGMDILTPSQLFDSDTRVPSSLIELQGSNILSSASHFVEESSRQIQGKMLSIIFPKYNNYLKNPSLFDKTSKFFIPLDILKVSYKNGLDNSNATSDFRRSVVAYCIYRTAGVILPQTFDSHLKQRYGVELNIPSTVMSAVILTSEGHVLTSTTETPIKYRIRVDYVNQRANPQCVHWKSDSHGRGLWTRENCWTEFSDPWVYNQEDYHVNCTCSSLGPTTVIMNKEEPYAVIESTIAEDIITYIGLVASVAFLTVAFICLSIIRGLQTNSNSIHRNLIICLLLAQAVYLLALKLRSLVHHHEFLCKLMAMGLHYIWLSVFSWLMIESIHIYRMLNELRDINHGQMRFYYSLGYGLPAIILGLSVGVRADQYGNYFFCWLSIYENVIWSLVGPCCVMIACTLAIFGCALKAAFTVKDHIEGYGNLRNMIWLGLALLPLTSTVWVLATLSASDPSDVLFYALSLCSTLESIYIMLGYCLLNARVRAGLLQLAGRKVIEEEISSPNSDLRGTIARSSLAYQNSYQNRNISIQRHLGISNSSTTSRSTCKTSSSNYRNDTRDLSTSTASRSSYDSRVAREVLNSPYAYDSQNDSFHDSKMKVRRGLSENEDSDGRQGIDLASSHTSDEEESTVTRTLRLNRNIKENRKPELPSKPTFMPNICESSELPIPPPTPPQTLSGSNLLRPFYSPAWSSQLPPPAYPVSVPYASGKWVTERLSNTTASDSEQTGPNLTVNPQRFPINLSRNYDLYSNEDHKKQEQMPSLEHNFQGLHAAPNINNEDSSINFISRNHVMDDERITVPITSSEMTDSEYV